MDKPNKKIKLTIKSGKAIVKVGDKEMEIKKLRPRKIVKQGITKEQFLTNLEKVCQPIKSDSEKTET